MGNLHHVVIIGTGFAGISAARSILARNRGKVRVTLIGEKNHFVFTPMLHEAASGVIASHHPAVAARSLVSGEGLRFVMATLLGIDRVAKTVETTRGTFSYDTLVLATGATTEFFGVEGAETHALTLKTIGDASRLRTRLVEAYEQALATEDPEERRRLLTVVVVGGGPTGVEFAAEVASLMHDTMCPSCDHDLEPQDMRVCLVHRGDHVLDMFPASLQKVAMASLRKRGVELHLEEEVVQVDETGVRTKSGTFFSAGTVLWAAGVCARDLVWAGTPPEITSRGRILVTEALHLPEDSSVFVLGDAAQVPTKDGRGLPMLAQVAQQQGRYLGKTVARTLAGKTLRPFRPHLLGELVSLGRWSAIGVVLGIPVRGVLASFLWKGVYLMKYGFMPGRLRILTEWFLGMVSRRDMTIE